MIIIKFHQVSIKHDVHLEINAKLDLNQKNKIRNEFLDSIMYRTMVSYIIYDLLVDKLNVLVISRLFYVN